ncbi:MAG: carbohydrate ABC transporter permease [Herpetosiphonaceae bacterium]|nr:carbohydrate ABC transporter permease [Herpetosiphonaceae bacterium]
MARAQDSHKVQRRAIARGLMHALMILVCIACAVPLLLIVSASLTDERALVENGFQLIPSKFSFYAYQFLLADSGRILRAYGISIFVTCVGASLSLLLMSLLGYALSRKDFPLRRLISFFVFFPLLFNAGLVPFYILMSRTLHLKDNLLALILPPLVLPFFTLLLRTYFSTLPRDLIEAAKLDGASEWRIFFQIVVPLSTPALATVGLFSLLFYWNDFYLSLLFINNPRYYNLQYLLYKIISDLQVLENSFMQSGTKPPLESVRMAMAVLAMGPVLFAFLFVQKYFVRGITVGSLKGD